MRPVRITLEGFSAYRNRQTLELENVEFFSLSGPTGSGKSSLIDAMIFALYGRVPRLGARAVAPVITAGSDRSRVSLVFEVRGEQYVASRVAERTDSGASVREARLEKADGSSIASGAGEVTRAVEELLRLRFEDFTKTVVLPQGEFARFLNAGSKERRDLLRDLLGLDIYSRVRELANQRRAVAADRASSARSQLGSLEVPDPEDLEAGRTRLAALEELSGSMPDRIHELEKLEASVEATVKDLEDVDDGLRRLSDISPPDHLEELDERLVASREAEALAEQAIDTKDSEITAVEEALEELPGEETIAGLRSKHEELAKLDERMADLDTARARAEAGEAEHWLEEAEKKAKQVGESVDAARMSHAAHAARGSLEIGEPCPVCARRVEAIPNVESPPELGELEEELGSVRAAVSAAREELREKRAVLTEAETRASEMAEHRERLAGHVADAMSLHELEVAEERRGELTRSLRAKRSQLEDLETALKRARRDHDAAAEAVRSVDRGLWMARDTVADLKPPYPDSDDPIVRWKEFLIWRDGAVDDLGDERRSLGELVDRERTSLAELRGGMEADLVSLDVPAEMPYDVSLTRELEKARGHVAKLEEVVERAAGLELELEQSERAEAVAGALANHLRANGFERWLMTGAITGLVSGANELLAQLSGGGYSLEADEEGSFRIIDHRNADEIRDVATLSGGETFLVSLALSLSLAETLFASGGGGLDAIILDEGFGTLDEESLDVVASVLEELAGRGLMVGVITHVKELAARAPVRYQVTREPEGSKVVELS